MQRFLVGGGASLKADATSNGSPESPPHPPTISAHLFSLGPRTECPEPGGSNYRSKATPATFYVICTFKLSPRPDPGGTTHIRLTSLPSGLGEKKKKKSGKARGWAEPHLGYRADHLLGLGPGVCSAQGPRGLTTMEPRPRLGATCLLGFSFLLLVSSDGHVGLGKGQTAFLS